MNESEAVAAILAVAISLYAVFGGADFGGGVWDFLATGPRKEQQRDAIASAIGPVWETNHVWLIFIIVLLFSCFPQAFAELSIRYVVPLTLVLIGIVLRGAAFVFRGYASDATTSAALWGHVFGGASLITPFLFGMIAGGISAGEYAWTSPFGWAIGCYALAICAQLAAVFLPLEATEPNLRRDFRFRAIVSTIVVAGIGLAALAVAEITVPAVFATLFRRVSEVAIAWTMGWGILLLVMLSREWYAAARIAVALEAVGILGVWFAAQTPYLLPGHVTIAQAAAPPATLDAILWITGIGAMVLIPSLVLLFVLFKGKNPAATENAADGLR